ncbi:MAG: polysaccharide biosynthesis tyrosine autokinase [Bacteroidales bacterium]|nr:polysaccharide biosynthesis tyrosine autokinase [Bacteroidales bacterium]
METNNNYIPNQQNNSFEKETSRFSFKDVLFMFINNWYWFVISIVICSGVAMFIYKTKPRIYQESAQILIRVDNVSKAEDVSTLLGNGGADRTFGFRIESEIYILRSVRLMERVVKRLDLQPTYKYISMFEKYEYYHDSPIHLSVFDNNGNPAEDVWLDMEVMPLSSSEYKYSLSNGRTSKASFGSKIRIDAGHTFVIDKTDNLNEQFYSNHPITVNYQPSFNRANQIVGNLSVNNISSSSKGLLNVSITSENFVKSREIIDTLIAVYNEDANYDKKQKTRKTEEFILTRISSIYGELENVESRIDNIRRASGVPYTGTASVSTSEMYIEKSNRYQDDALMLESELSNLNYIKSQLDDPTKRNDYLPPVDAQSSALQRVIEKYNDAKMQYDESLTIHGENNPATKRLAQTLESAREGVNVVVRNMQQSLRMRIQNAHRQENMAKQYASNINNSEKAVADVMRQQKIKESLYLYLLNKREEVALALAVSEDVAKTVEAAGATSRISPDKRKFISAGIATGFAIPLFIMLLIVLLDDRLKSKTDVEKNLTIPILCEIPQKGKEQEGLELVVSENGTDTLTEAFRIMYSNVQFFLRSNDKKVIQFLSSLPHEGKTYAVMNFAVTMAYLGKKVVLVDLDCRKRQLSRVMDRSNRHGVIEYLISKDKNVDSIINNSSLSPNLDYVVCEKTAPNITQLLYLPDFDNLISELKERYDYVVFDSAPSNVVADSAIINRCADLSIYVMRVNVFNKRLFPFVQQLYDDKKLKNMAIVLTDVPMLKHHYGYGYGTGYGYGYGYGYSYGYSDENSNSKKRFGRKKKNG